MLPGNGDDLEQGFALKRQPDLTFRLDFETGRAVGTVDELEAVKQAIFLALNTERFAYEIFTPNYGNELTALLGTAPPLVYAQIEQAIKEALSVDDRITGVSGFVFSKKQGAVTAAFTVSTVYGDVQEEREVAV